MSYRGSGYGRGDGRSRDYYRGNSRFNNQTSTRGYYPPKYEKDHSNRNLGHTGQNGYYNQQFSGDYYTRSTDDQYNNGYLPQQYNRSQPYTPSAKLSTSNETSYKDRGRNLTEVPSSRKESGVAKNYSSSKQIVKNYNFTDKTQGNLISQLNAMTAFSDNAMNSFRTSYSKDPQNSNKKKAFLEYTDVCSSKLDDPKISEMYYKMLTKPQSKPVDKIYLPIFKYDKNSLAEKPSNEILIWNLHSGTTSLFIINNFSKYGKINECKLIDDPLTAVPMGMCLLSFDGKVEQAHMVALKAVEETNKQLIIHGRCIRSALNIKNKIYDEIYKKTMEVRAEMSRKKKLEELEKEKKARREEYRLAQEAELNRQKLKEKLPLAPKSTANSNGQMISGSLLANKQKEHVDSSVKPSKESVHDNHIVPLSNIVLSFKLQRLVQNRPVIFIADKYVSSLHVSSDQIRRHLSRYSINRVLQQRNGFFLIFNSLNEAMTCFDNEDGKKFMRYTTYMTLYVPDGQIDDTRVGTSGTLKLAQKEIMKELNAYLFKDIREKIIGQKVLEILNNDEIERLAETALERKRADEDAYQSQVKSTIEKPLNEIDTISFKPETVRIVNNFDINSLQKNRVSKKSFVPMSHALNGIQSDESDDDEDEDEDDEENDNDNDEVAVKVGAAAANIPSPKSASSTTANEINDANNNGGKKRKNNDIAIKDSKRKKKKTATNKESTIEPETLNDEIDEDDANGDVNSITNSAESQITSPEYDLKPLTPVPTIMDEFQPSTKLGPVYDESEFLPTLDHLKNCIKTDEDFRILSELCKDIQINEPIKDLNFWAWEHLELVKESLKLKEDKEEEYGDNTEKFDFEDEVLNSNELKNTTGSFRTQGYHKIPDKHKAQYMLHRRKLTNLNPVKNEDTDERNAQTHNNIQSSRVNRANTRRFVADISAQKQIIGETDLLDLNQLNKRKKPVIFARSAIHNWGLYALEPISAGEMIIEYVGERIRQQVAEVREKNYLRSGIGSSYLFRVDENTVIDASKKGGIARFINHCCEPSCTAKIIKVGGKKRIVIYALRDVKKNEELTYDYKFEREINDEERIPCLCGAPGCKGYLN